MPILWIPETDIDRLGDWANPRRIRSLASAITEHDRTRGGNERIIVRHELVRRVTPEMLEWWYLHFPYYAVKFPDGVAVTAYGLWHPFDHGKAVVLQHSLSGQIGLACGANLELHSRWGSENRRTTLEVVRMDKTGLRMKIVSGSIIIGVVEELFRAAKHGTQCTSILTLSGAGQPYDRLPASRRFSSAIVSAWAKHKVEELGNLERILPIVFNSARRTRDRGISVERTSLHRGASL